MYIPDDDDIKYECEVLFYPNCLKCPYYDCCPYDEGEEGHYL